MENGVDCVAYFDTFLFVGLVQTYRGLFKDHTIPFEPRRRIQNDLLPIRFSQFNTGGRYLKSWSLFSAFPGVRFVLFETCCIVQRDLLENEAARFTNSITNA